MKILEKALGEELFRIEVPRPKGDKVDTFLLFATREDYRESYGVEAILIRRTGPLGAVAKEYVDEGFAVEDWHKRFPKAS